MMKDEHFRALRVSHAGEKYPCGIEQVRVEDLPDGDVLVRVEYSSINYKDALSATGAPGVTREYPHTPGIDAAGTVVETTVDNLAPGDRVIVGGGGFGSTLWGGFGEYVRVPVEMVTAMPAQLTARESMIYGTAGFTAGMCVKAILDNGVSAGSALVTGASGGVGSFAVSILAQEGFTISAVTGKKDSADYLKALGASEVLTREDAVDGSSRPLLPGKWNAVVDSVGGSVLATAIRSCAPHGIVAACGNAASADLPLTVYPFILRGVVLAGIDSTSATPEERSAVWDLLSSRWRPRMLSGIASECSLAEVPAWIEKVLRGSVRGRVLVNVANS
jgi:putative YhdH/YhfP family quinone oxidoreductase